VEEFFPSFEPAKRSYDFGDIPLSEANGFAGGSMRFTHATEAIGHGLTLEYEELSEAQARTIRRHYFNRQGGFLSFYLPAVVWRGHPTVDTLVPAGGRWKYAAEPEETHQQGKLYRMTVQLQYVGGNYESVA
jgi:hypothetical protein